MEFYKKLTDLLKCARELQELDSYKNVEHSIKAQLSKDFKDKLLLFLDFKVFTEESRKFRKYWIKYLDKLINSCLRYCSNSENSQIKDLLDKINNENEIKYNFQNINNIKRKEIKDKNNQNDIGNLFMNDYNNSNKNNKIEKNERDDEALKFNIDLKEEDKLNINEIIGFQDKENLENNNIINEHFYPEEVKNSFKDNLDYVENDENIYKNNINSKKNIDDKENLKDNIINIEKNYKMKDINNNIIKKKSKEEISLKKEKSFEINKKINPEFPEINPIQNNNINYNNQIFQEKEKKKEKDINIINAPKEEKKPESKKNKQNNAKKKLPAPKKDKKVSKIEEECDELLDNNNKNNIIQIIFNSLFDNKNNANNISDINEKTPKIFNFVKSNKNNKLIDQNLKEKLITLICILYPFSKGNKSSINEDGNIFETELSSEKELYQFLNKSIIIKPPDNFNFKFVDFNVNKIPISINNFCNDLKINLTSGKYEIYNAFIFLVILRNLRKYDKEGKYKKYFENLLEKEFVISYKLRFVLEHQEYYSSITDDFLDIYKGLHFIKIFYDEIFSEIQVIQKDENSDNYIFGKENFVLSLDKYCDLDLDKYSDLDLKILFEEKNNKDNQIYENVMKKIEHFYNIDRHSSLDIYNLINYSSNKLDSSENNFILNLVDLEQKKIENIYNDINKYKERLMSLEEDIFKMGKEALNLNQKLKIISEYFINKEQKDTFDSLLINIKTKINKNFKYNFDLYPYGSVTEFLGSKTSDIDVYLNIKNIESNSEKIRLLEELCRAINKIIGYRPNVIISARLCVIKFKYGANNVDFDISIMGFCPYLHSILFRTYSLIEPRFSLLAIALKKFIEIINIKSAENKIEFLNSFSWMILLITFLQDIIQPQVLPKLLSDEKNSIINIQIQYGKNFKVKNDFSFHNEYKTIKSFIPNIKEETSQIPSCFFDKEKSLYQIYQERAVNIQKNELSCAEIFLSFLEYVIYYFKYDSVYVNCCIENEGFESIKNIMNFDDKIDKNKKDDRFFNYFKNKYCKQKNYGDNTKTRDGLILIRDPFDPHYNPAQSFRKGQLNTFMEHLKLGYLSLIKHGSFEVLKRDFEEKFKKEGKWNNFI